MISGADRRSLWIPSRKLIIGIITSNVTGRPGS